MKLFTELNTGPACTRGRCYTQRVTTISVRLRASVPGQDFAVRLFHSQLQAGLARRFLRPCVRRGFAGVRGASPGREGASHPAIGQDNPTASLNFILEPFGEAFVVSRVVEQLSTNVSTGDDVVIGASELNSWGTRQGVFPCWYPGLATPSLHLPNTEHKA